MQMKLLLQKENAAHTNNLQRNENKNVKNVTADGVDTGA